MKDPGSVYVQEILEDRLDALVSGVSARVQLVIAEALKNAKAENWTYADSYIRYNEDMLKIQQVLSDGRFTAYQTIDQMFDDMAAANDAWAARFYEAKSVSQVSASEHLGMSSLLSDAKKRSQEIINATLKTSAIGIVDKRGSLIGVGDFYKRSVSSAITGMLAGEESYSKAVRNAVSEMVRSGLRTSADLTTTKTKYASGATREIYGAARMNILDTYRQTLSDLRKVQGKEFGADGVEISAHSPCAEDHVEYQGLQFTQKEFDKIQSSLDRPYEQWNCKHIVFPVILGISSPAYTKEDLEEMRDSSEEMVSIKGLSGEDLEMSRYDASQYQRKIEQSLRKAKTDEYLQRSAGQDTKDLKDAIRQRQADYNRISAEAGLTTRPERTRAYIAS